MEKDRLGANHVENWNSLGIFTHSWKLDRLNYLLKHLKIAVVTGCETQCDWSIVKPGQHFLDSLLPGTTKKGVASHNITETIHRDQKGGTAIAGLGRLCDIITASGCDPTGLGQFSWITMGFNQTQSIIISAYLPCKPGKASGRTVWEQHLRFFQSIGDFRDPDTILIDMLLNHISSW